LRILINSFSIESILVAESRAEADRQLQQLGRGVAWTIDAYTVQRFPLVQSPSVFEMESWL
jgi:structural maintenance of chromosomes protein 6